MLYVVAILCPPVAVLCTGRFFTAIAVLFLSLVYFPGAIVALLIVANYYADQRAKQTAWEIQRRVAATLRQYDEVVLSRQGAGVTKSPHPRPKLPESLFETPPEAPRVSLRERFGFAILDATNATKSAYASLPDWLQPILWGFAAATPAVLAIAVIMARR